MTTAEVSCARCGRRSEGTVRYRHRLVCADASDPEAHDRLIGGDPVALVLTDPPYGVGVGYGEATDDTPEFVSELMGRVMPLLLRHPVVLLTPGHTVLWDYPRPSWLLAWVHPAGMGNGPWGFTMLHPVLAYGKDPYLAHQAGRRPDVLVLAADRKEEGVAHPVVKPLEVWEWLLVRGSYAAGDVVLDSFGGGGTTLVAAERTGRRALLIEIEPRWVDVICKRWQAHFGSRPRREDGTPVDFA